jgi:uncharacterized membrane protein YfcA
MKFVFLAVLVGLLSGLLAALCGVGGGIVMVPFFTAVLGLSHKQAVATSLAVIVPTALAATLRNATGPDPLVRWPVFFAAAAGSMVVAWLAADWMRSLGNETLRRVFAVLLILVGVRMLLAKG